MSELVNVSDFYAFICNNWFSYFCLLCHLKYLNDLNIIFIPAATVFLGIRLSKYSWIPFHIIFTNMFGSFYLFFKLKIYRVWIRMAARLFPCLRINRQPGIRLIYSPRCCWEWSLSYWPHSQTIRPGVNQTDSSSREDLNIFGIIGSFTKGWRPS